MPYGNEEPSGSILPDTLYNWNASQFTCQPQSQLEAGKGYWLLSFAACSLSFNDPTVAAPAILPSVNNELVSQQPTIQIPLVFSSQQRRQELIIGLDVEAKNSLDWMDRPIPPVSPQDQGFQISLLGGQYRLRRDVQPIRNDQVRWQMHLSSPQPVQLTIDSQKIPDGQELVISDVFSAYLGCELVFMPSTTWAEPCINDWEDAEVSAPSMN